MTGWVRKSMDYGSELGLRGKATSPEAAALERTEWEDQTLTDVLMHAIDQAHENDKQGKGSALIVDDAARKVRAMIMEAISPADKEEIPEADRDYETDPNPPTWRYKPGEFKREAGDRMLVGAILRQAMNRL